MQRRRRALERLVAAGRQQPVLAATVVAGALSIATRPKMRDLGLVTGPWWATPVSYMFIALLHSGPGQRLIGGGRSDNRPALRTALVLGAMAATTYMNGVSIVFGPLSVVITAYLIQRCGSAVRTPAIVTVAVATALGETALALGWISSVLPVAQAHYLAITMSGCSLIGLYLMGNSAAAREQAAAELSAAHARFQALVHNSSDVVTLLDDSGISTYMSPAVERVLGYAPGDLVGHSSLRIGHPDDVGALARIQAEDCTSAPVSNEVRMRHADGSWRWVEVAMQDMRHDPAVGGWVANWRDVTERHLYHERVPREATVDPLTGLLNRRSFLERVNQAATTGTGTRALVFADLDRFKVMNDSLGHLAGDRLLQVIAERFTQVVRGDDVVGRFGGDEFVVILHDLDCAEAADVIAQRLLDAVAAPIDLDGTRVQISASIGIAVTDGPVATDDLIHAADSAMYESKNFGPGRFMRYRGELGGSRDPVAVDRESELRRAITAGEIQTWFQPVVDPSTDEIVAVEALVRWCHPERGVLGPYTFLDLADQTGLSIPIGHLVLDDACVAARRLSDALGRVIGVSVNLSARQLLDASLSSRIRQATIVNRLAPGQLWMELTESSALLEVPGAPEILSDLRAAGVRIALDDFGAGYSTLNWLRLLPVDGLKIDRSFVAGTTSVDAAVCEAVIGMARRLGLTVVAEGVETDAELRRVTDLGCPLVQGYLYAKPAPIDTVVADWGPAASAVDEPATVPRRVPGRLERAVAMTLPLV